MPRRVVPHLTALGMGVTPIATAATAGPAVVPEWVDAYVREASRADGWQVCRVEGLESPPDLDGPAATLACLEQGRPDATTPLLAAAAGAATAVLFDAPRTGGAVIGAGLRVLAAPTACERAVRLLAAEGE